MVITILATLAVATFGAVSAQGAPSGFVTDPVYTGLVYPTNVEFAPNGRVFILEKGGRILTASSIGAPLTVFADLSSNVHDFWDRGALGLAIHPNFPSQPYVYILYAYGVPISVPGGPTQSWGDGCPGSPGATADGCVVSARLSRLTSNAGGSTMVGGSELVLIRDWCQQFPSHSIGDVEFGVDGALYVSGGDGASFNGVDYGQLGGTQQNTPTPKNPCGDPPTQAGTTLSPPTAEGGALRSQDLRTGGDPVTLAGTIIRVDPATGAALTSNPNFSTDNDPNENRIVAYGLRNPYRFTFRPGTTDLYIGDVGWNTWEEVNRHSNPASQVRNFGWPCYEGGSGTSLPQSGYNSAGLSICQTLYNQGGVNSSLFAYAHNQDIAGDDECPPATPGPTTSTSSSVTGLAFYPGGNYPGTYNGALFGADYSRNCIWVMYPNGSGIPVASSVEVFDYQPQQGTTYGISPVDLEMGPDGNMWYVSYLRGQVGRYRYTGSNTPPNAVINTNPTSGSAPLQVTFNGSGSNDPDGQPITYAWDLDNDGQFDDGSTAIVSWTYTQPGGHTARLRVTDFPGETGTASVQIQVSNQPPVPVIDTPSSSLTWHVGETVSFSGHATDPNQGNLPASGLRWQLLLHHCENDGSCHVHPIQAYNGVSSGNFAAPDHPYPSHLELILTATDQFGSQTSMSINLQPETVEIDFRTVPGGLKLTVGGLQHTAPTTETFIKGSIVSIGANSPQPSGGSNPWLFTGWSDGGARSHEITANGSTGSYIASFSQVLGPADGASVGVVDVTTGLWYLRDAASGETTRFYYGNPGDIPMVGDWDCDGDETPGLYRQSDGYVYLRNSNTQGVANIKFFFGNPGDIPVAGDFNGNGCDTVSIYRPSEGRVYVMNHLGNGDQGLGNADFQYYFGNPGDKPFAGDFDDDDVDEIGLHRESTGLVYFRYTHTQGVADKSFIFGNPGDRIIAGRWAQIGVPGADTVGLFRPSNGNFYLRFSNTAGNADLSFKYGNSRMWPVAGIFGSLPGGGGAPPG